MKLTEKEKAALFRDTIPKQLVIRIISVIQMVEHAALERANEMHGKNVGELDHSADGSCHYHLVTDSKGAPFSYALLKVINWWTTFLLPTVEQWQESSWIDADVSYLIDRIKTKRKVVLASLICKRVMQGHQPVP